MPAVGSDALTARGLELRPAGEAADQFKSLPDSGQTPTVAPATTTEMPVLAVEAAAATPERPTGVSADSASAPRLVVVAAGISAADSNALVKTTENLDNPSAMAEKNLPDAVVSAAWGPKGTTSDLPKALAEFSAQKGSDLASQSANSVPPPTAHAVAPVTTTTAAASEAVAPPRLGVLERTEHLISTHLLRFKELAADSVSAVLRPDPQTELLLKVSFREGRVEAQAQLQTGDYTALSSQWQELQQKLAAQGVRLTSLARHPGLMDIPLGGFGHSANQTPRQRAAPPAPVPELRHVAPVAKTPDRAVRAATAPLGWESWA